MNDWVRNHIAVLSQFVFDDFIKIVFVKTGDNDSDLFTKNLGGESCERHSNKIVIKKGKEE